MVDVTADVQNNPDFLLTVERVQQWESKIWAHPCRSMDAACAPDGQNAPTPKQYINLQDDGPHTPGFVKDCSDFLAKERDVLGVGVETVGTDAGRAATFNPPFPNHYVMHGSGKFGLAGLCNLDQLPQPEQWSSRRR